MPHDWVLYEVNWPDYNSIKSLFGSSYKKSDLHFCKKCNQVSLSEVGAPPDDNFFGIKDCETAIIKTVLED